MRRSLIAIVSLAALPAVVHAQGRGGGMMSGMGHSAAMAAPHAIMHASPPSFSMTSRPSSGIRVVSGTHLVRTRSGALVIRPAQRTSISARSNGYGSTRALLSQDVPGLGFDYTHYAAVHPLGTRGQGRNRGVVYAYFPFYGGGYYEPIYPDSGDEAPPVEAQPVVENSGPEPEPAPSRSRYADAQQSHAPAPEPAPERESDQYVFVRRDGTVFFAVAYAWENGTLRYVTNEGVRHSLAGDKLDLDATQQFNEQRGLSFQTPTA